MLIPGVQAAKPQKVTLMVDDVPVAQVLQALAEQEKLNLVVSPDVSGTVSLHLTDVPWKQALQTVVKSAGLITRQEGNILSVHSIAWQNNNIARQEAEQNKKLLSLETVIAASATVNYLVMIFAAVFAVEMLAWRLALILTGLVILVVAIAYALRIEHDAGYYECPHCGARYIPTMRAVVLAPHIGRSRSMKCPRCGQRGYHKKVLTK